MAEFLADHSTEEYEPMRLKFFDKDLMTVSQLEKGEHEEKCWKILKSSTKLEILDLSSNNLVGNIPSTVRELASLKALSLAWNGFNGSLPIPGICELNRLQELDLNGNSFEGIIPQCLNNMTSLRLIDLGGNHFEGSFKFSLLMNHSKLKTIMLTCDGDKLKIDAEHLHQSPLFQLETLKLSNCDLPSSIVSQAKLQVLDCPLTISQEKYLRSYLHGSLSLPNNVELSSLEVFDISNNRIEGEIPSWIGNLTSLQILSLNKNLFKGQFPCKEKLLSMEYLDLSHNFFKGPLPYFFNQNSLKQLNLEGNQFWGSMPSELFNFSALKVLNLRDNNLSGSIPYNINGNLPSLKVLSLGNNYLKGLIPKLFCQLTNINTLDLSNNCFSGPIPQCFYNITFGKIEAKRAILNSPEYSTDFSIAPPYEIHGNLLKYISVDLEPSYAFRTRFEFDFVTKNRFDVYKAGFLYLMSGLDLSCNNLTGKIPVALGNLSSIHALNLSHNRLAGAIPISLSKLVEIESLDLSYNYLSGEIPSELTNLVRLEVFNVSHNNLSGKIPSTNQFSTFEESSYEENPLLCGRPLNKSCTNPPTPYLLIVPSDEAQGKWFEVDFIAFYASFGVTYLVFLLGFVTVLFINPFWRRKWFHFVENFLSSSYYFAYASLGKLWN
ncbi:probable LRR receptor-like serine/threonine-protein kinase At4g36180 [Durio zibethinus]|uniref:Probable LRR receptor-like serine/threonine-protein kinase At4g36180 n=1 Tax=Durio zibethinus TaxID=66656 RepID=A0A6P5YND6_DURZI|nr:probable LRR receptor-like serine/threonine-protein kinase At4g36180 [Durio zibethinus]